MDDQETVPERARLLEVAIGTYDHHERLGDVVKVATELAHLFRRAGFVHDHPELVGERVLVDTSKTAMEWWFQEHEPIEQALAYWTGHGLRSNRRELLLAGTDTPVRPKIGQAIDPLDLFDLLIDSSARVCLLI